MRNLTTIVRIWIASLLFAVCAFPQTFVAKPLNDLGRDQYKGFSGGLYENGSNTVPADHHADGLALAEQIKPIRGKFVLLAVGMSNAAMEFFTFQNVESSDGRVNHSSMALVRGAQGSMTACAWASAKETPREHGCKMPRYLPNQYDRIRDEVLKPAGLGEDQVEVVWMKNADPRPTVALPSQNAEAYEYERYIGDTARALRARYPNLKLLFISSRIYAGYARVPLNPEPYAYEYGFSVKWAIQAQINQMRRGLVDPIAGNLDYKKGAAPWIAWGPYLWADGTAPRSDRLTWEESDFMADRTHPNAKGREKVAGLLMDFFLHSPYTRWFKK
jgi:hypothetical protein